MFAHLEKNGEGYTARFERELPHPPEDVWAYLTRNDKLQIWFAELRIEELGKNGRLSFDMGDGSFENMDILDYEEGAVLEYVWGEDSVRFELTQTPQGTKLTLVETINALTPHTPRDLAGWHVCLDVVALLLDGQDVPKRKEMWEQEYIQYSAMTDKLLHSR
ncbi:SRPBCC family protein [Paenibacillus sp. strain BS8-2]